MHIGHVHTAWVREWYGSPAYVHKAYVHEEDVHEVCVHEAYVHEGYVHEGSGLTHLAVEGLGLRSRK